jgi:MFS superfamily sulfate permease-like transporter
MVKERPRWSFAAGRVGLKRLRHVLAAHWLAEYQAAWLRGDVVAGVTVPAYAIPVSLGYAGLAGLPPQIGIYGYLLGGLG